MTSMLSREALFLLNNLLFMGILVVCFWGVIFPLISELVTGQKVTVGPPFYERATGPLFAGLLFLMGIAPLAAWGHSTIKTLGRSVWKPLLIAAFFPIGAFLSGIRNIAAFVGFYLVGFVIAVVAYEFLRGTRARMRSSSENAFKALGHLVERNRRRYGGYIIHLGVVCMALGVIGIEMFQTQTQGSIPQGGELTLGQYTIRYNSLAQFDVVDNRNVARAVVSVFKNGKYVGELHPRRDFYYESQQQMTIPGVRSTMEDDLYVLLVDWQSISSQGATFKVFHNPLVNWLWLGGFIFIFGTLIAAWPDKDPEYEKARVPASKLAPAKA